MTRKLKTFHDKAENKRTGPEWTGYRTGPDKKLQGMPEQNRVGQFYSKHEKGFVIDK